MKKNKKLQRNILISVAMIATVASVSAGTYAFLAAQRSGQANVGDVGVSRGLSVDVYSFNGNYKTESNSDSESIEKCVGYDREKVDLSSYDSLISEEATASPLLRKMGTAEETTNLFRAFDLNPGTAFTLAFRVTAKGNYSIDVGLDLVSYKSFFGEENVDDIPTPRRISENGEAERDIYITEAIDMFAAPVVGDSNLEAAKSFIAEPKNLDDDKFEKIGNGSDDSAMNLTTQTYFSSPTFFFFTIEFSNDSKNNFLYQYSQDGVDYYSKQTSGNSNVYSLGAFSISRMAVNIKKYH